MYKDPNYNPLEEMLMHHWFWWIYWFFGLIYFMIFDHSNEDPILWFLFTNILLGLTFYHFFWPFIKNIEPPTLKESILYLLLALIIAFGLIILTSNYFSFVN